MGEIPKVHRTEAPSKTGTSIPRVGEGKDKKGSPHQETKREAQEDKVELGELSEASEMSDESDAKKGKPVGDEPHLDIKA